MFAIVKIGGQQFRVKEGQSFYVPHMDGKKGDSIDLTDVMMVSNDGKLQLGDAIKATVKAEITEEMVQGDKVIAFKMKRRKGFRKKIGHRTQYTQLRISSIA